MKDAMLTASKENIVVKKKIEDKENTQPWSPKPM
jgi:hypothetical protein